MEIHYGCNTRTGEFLGLIKHVKNFDDLKGLDGDFVAKYSEGMTIEGVVIDKQNEEGFVYVNHIKQQRIHNKIVKYFKDSRTMDNKQAQDAWDKCVEELKSIGYTHKEIYQAKCKIF